jgi:hypothetical protein
MGAPIVGGSTWMTQSFSQIGSRPLRSIAVPGAHDSGMSTLTASTTGSFPCNTQTQSVDILQQLESGVRYFDFRPVTWPDASDFYHGHFSGGAGSYWGSTGQSLSSALDQLAQFVQQPGAGQEVVVFKLSHFLSLASGFSFGPLKTVTGSTPSVETFQQLVAFVAESIGPHLLTSSDPSISLNDATFSDLAASSGRIIVVFDLAGGNGTGLPASLVNPARGIFSYNDDGKGAANLVVYDNYYGQSDLSGMVLDQQNKFKNFTPGPGTSFLLSWTLTQTNPLSSTCISDLARSANSVLEADLQTWKNDGIITASKIPSVVYTDYVAYPNPALTACMSFNYLP